MSYLRERVKDELDIDSLIDDAITDNLEELVDTGSVTISVLGCDVVVRVRVGGDN